MGWAVGGGLRVRYRNRPTAYSRAVHGPSPFSLGIYAEAAESPQ